MGNWNHSVQIGKGVLVFGICSIWDPPCKWFSHDAVVRIHFIVSVTISQGRACHFQYCDSAKVPASDGVSGKLHTCHSTTAAMTTKFTTSLHDFSHLFSNISLNPSLTSPFESLSPSEYILLLTPYLLHAPLRHLAHLSSPMDLFEPFGRSLRTHRANIRHAPYVARHGIVEVHKRLLDHTGCVIIVLCQTPIMKDVLSYQRLDRLKYQERFANEVIKYIEDELEDKE
jgi:hypothetical protein